VFKGMLKRSVYAVKKYLQKKAVLVALQKRLINFKITSVVFS